MKHSKKPSNAWGAKEEKPEQIKFSMITNENIEKK